MTQTQRSFLPSQRTHGTTRVATSGRTGHESATHMALREERQRRQGYRIPTHEPSSAGKSELNCLSNSVITAEPGHQLAADFASAGTHLPPQASGALREDLHSARILTTKNLIHRYGVPGQLAG